VARTNLLTRIATAGLPLVLIALAAGMAGYLTSNAESLPVPPLPPQEERATGVQGTLQSFSNDQLIIVSSTGATLTFDLPGESTIERLVAIGRDDLTIGDWINGGAIPHPETVLALVSLVLVSDPVIQTP